MNFISGSFSVNLPPADPLPWQPAPSAQAAAAIGGVTPFSSVDWPGQLAAVVFVAGCPWRCHYCHNPHLQLRQASLSWASVRDWLPSRRGLLDGVVFSGGEPLSEPALASMLAEVRALGFGVALHTAGIYPQRLASVLDTLDWVGLDIKTDAAGHDALTGKPRSHWPVGISLAMLLESGCAFECRTTWSPRWLPEPRLLALARQLADQGVRHYAVQDYRSAPGQPAEGALSLAAQQQLAQWFERFVYRQ